MFKTESVVDTYRYWKLKDIEHTLEGFLERELSSDRDFAGRIREAVEIIGDVARDYAKRYDGAFEREFEGIASIEK